MMNEIIKNYKKIGLKFFSVNRSYFPIEYKYYDGGNIGVGTQKKEVR